MSKGQRANKEAKKPKKAKPLVEDVLPVTEPTVAATVPTPRRKHR